MPPKLYSVGDIIYRDDYTTVTVDELLRMSNNSANTVARLEVFRHNRLDQRTLVVVNKIELWLRRREWEHPTSWSREKRFYAR